MGDHTVTGASALINQGKPKQALSDLYELKDNGDHYKDAHYWATRSLAEQLCHKPNEAALSIEYAQEQKNWQPAMLGDYYRDVALALLRQGRCVSRKNEKARQIAISEAIKAADGAFDEQDFNRKASILMTRGRRKFEDGDFTAAVKMFERADAMWRDDIDNADSQWMMNNRYHWFKALRRQAGLKEVLWGHGTDEMMHMYYYVIDIDPSAKRRMAAHLILVTGGLGVAIERRFT